MKALGKILAIVLTTALFITGLNMDAFANSSDSISLTDSDLQQTANDSSTDSSDTETLESSHVVSTGEYSQEASMETSVESVEASLGEPDSSNQGSEETGSREESIQTSELQKEINRCILSNGTVTLTKDTAVEAMLDFEAGDGVSGAEVTLDLNGYKLDTEDAEALIYVGKGVTLTIKGDGSAESKTDRGVVVYNEGIVKLSGADILATGADSIGILNQSTDNVEGLVLLSGTIQAKKYAVGKVTKKVSFNQGGLPFFCTLASISSLIDQSEEVGAGTYSVGDSAVVVTQSDTCVVIQEAPVTTTPAAPVTTAVAAPASLTATAMDYNSIALSWAAVTGASQYRVFRSTDAAAGFTMIGTAAANSYTDMTAVTGTIYYYHVQASNGTTNSPDSITVSAKTSLAVPSSIKAKINGYNSVKISWGKVNGATAYEIYRSKQSGAGFIKIGVTTGSSFKDKQLVCGVKYYFKVRALNATASSNDTAVKSAKPVPLAAKNFTAKGKNYNTIYLSWGKASGAKKYYLYRSTQEKRGFTRIATLTKTNYTDKGVKTGVKYYYKIVSYRYKTKGQTAVANATAVTAKVKSVKVTCISGTQASLSWKKTAGATKYYIYRSTDQKSGYKRVGSTKKLKYTDSRLSSGTVYYYKIYGVANGTKGKASSVVYIKVTMGKVTKLTASGAGAQKSKLSWEAVAGATSYRIYRSRNMYSNYVMIGETNQPAYIDSGLSDGVTYYYKVYARSNNTNGKPVRVSYVNPTGITLNSTSLNILQGSSRTLSVTIQGGATDRTISWTSSNTSVAKVSSAGLVTIVGNGSATITAATVNAKTAKCKVNASSITVVLDPGHGGKDSGAVANGLYEKTLNLKVAQYTKAQLEQYGGVTVYMTRSSDSYIDLAQRTAYASKHGASLFVSFHFNAGVSAAKGSEVYVSVNPAYNSSSNILASRILSNLCSLGLSNRGVKTRASSYDPSKDYYSVIRNSVGYGFPGILIEHAFVTNPSDASFSSAESNLRAMGVADADAIAAYYGLSKK